MDSPLWRIEFGESPLVAAALHDGSLVRPEVAAALRLDEAQRRYEEDPHTAAWTAIAATRIIARRSRFEFDLNRPRERAVYLAPADAWGLDVWRSPPAADVVERSLAAYDDFYSQVRLVLEGLLARYPRVVVFDLHSFNHRRAGRNGPCDDPQEKPEVNLGTRTMDRRFWAPVVDGWLAEMRNYNYLGRRLDVRENVNFFGGHFPAWIHGQFPRRVCALAVEVKKFFMDEWSGELDPPQHQAMGEALCRGAEGVMRVLENWHDAPAGN
jgi:N-formylglutamate amidohydrolase